MFLTPASVLQYLVDHNFADLETVVDGGFAVRDLSHRNRNFRVTCGSREYLVKQAKRWTSGGRESLDTEASLYRLIRNDERFKILRDLMPESYGYDPEHSILIHQFLVGQSDLHEVSDRFSPPIARMLGAAMARLHRETRAPEIAGLIPPEMPGLFSIHEEDPSGRTGITGGQRELIRLIRKRPAFGQLLGVLQAEWKDRCLIHGDWKLANCIVSADRAGVRMVDWEYAAWGEPLYDAGTLLQSYWGPWVSSPEDCPLERIRPAITAFLETYAADSGAPLAEIVVPVIRFAAARMLQSAFEAVQREEELNSDAVRLAQASLYVLTKPAWAAEQILGIASCAAN